MEEAKTCLAARAIAIYRSAILPKLDCCCAVWDPHHYCMPWTEFNGFLAGSSHTNGSPTTPSYWTP